MNAADRVAFHDQFISFRALGVAARLGWSELHAQLDADGMRSAGGSATICSRADIAHMFT
ncbi:hypothetical protein [Paracoccus ravus]|uniref:hypothetical protein n=1 Tax=Paracoccus ravus TaxID=2447760 RepID=UPI00106EC3C7|nr:hypothetical protein [Paracoccus ravus]